jgi:hypothetical protein
MKIGGAQIIGNMAQNAMADCGGLVILLSRWLLHFAACPLCPLKAAACKVWISPQKCRRYVAAHPTGDLNDIAS